MSNIAATNLTQRPMTLDEIQGQNWIIKLLKKYIAEDRYPPAFLFYGPGGCGKSTTIGAFIRTVLCLNRKPGETAPCLSCASCEDLRDPTKGLHPHVTWVQLGKGPSRGEDSLNSQVNQALEAAKSAPPFSNEPHQNYQFIIVDEVHNLPVNQLQRFLYLPEAISQLEHNRVRLIFSTMCVHRIHPDVAPSLRGRALPLQFRAPSFEELKQVTQKIAPQASESLINKVCNHVYRYEGGYRSLIQYLDLFAEFGYDLELARQILGGMYLEEIDHFWYLCSLCTYKGQPFKDVRQYFEYMLQLCGQNHLLLLEQLMDSLMMIMETDKATPAHFEALRAVTHAFAEKPHPPHWILKYCYGLPYIPLPEN